MSCGLHVSVSSYSISQPVCWQRIVKNANTIAHINKLTKTTIWKQELWLKAYHTAKNWLIWHVYITIWKITHWACKICSDWQLMGLDSESCWQLGKTLNNEQIHNNINKPKNNAILTLWLNTSIRICINNFLYFCLAEEALVSAHPLMLNTRSEQSIITQI